MRLSEIADRLAALEGLDADEIHIRLRNPLFKGLLQGESGRSRNSPADYPALELIRAHLLMAMFDCGLSTAELAAVNEMFQLGRLENLISKAIKGDVFNLSFHITNRDRTGNRTVGIKFNKGSKFDVDCINGISGVIIFPLSYQIRKIHNSL